MKQQAKRKPKAFDPKDLDPEARSKKTKSFSHFIERYAKSWGQYLRARSKRKSP